MGLSETIKIVLSMNKEQRISIAKDAVQEIQAYGEYKRMKNEEIGDLLFSLTKLFVSSDNDCSYFERDLFNKTFSVNFTEIQFEEITSRGNDLAFRKKMKKTIKRMDADTRTSTLIFGLAIMCADNELSEKEKQLIKEIYVS